MDTHPGDPNLRAIEKTLLTKFAKLSEVEEACVKQRSRIQWLALGDQNTSYFHKCINGRGNYKKITSLVRNDGSKAETVKDVENEPISFYEILLGYKPAVPYPGSSQLSPYISAKLSDVQNCKLAEPVTAKEVKDVMYSLHSNKAPGPDGYTALFFQETWSITGDLVTKAILDFFRSGKLLKQFNATAFTLVPKAPNASL